MLSCCPKTWLLQCTAQLSEMSSILSIHSKYKRYLHHQSLKMERKSENLKGKPGEAGEPLTTTPATVAAKGAICCAVTIVPPPFICNAGKWLMGFELFASVCWNPAALSPHSKWVVCNAKAHWQIMHACWLHWLIPSFSAIWKRPSWWAT